MKLISKSLFVIILYGICIFRSAWCKNRAFTYRSWSWRKNLTSIVVADACHPGHRIPKLSFSNFHNNASMNERKDDTVIVDVDKLLVKVGSACSMEKLLQQTMQHGMLPKVLPELKQITVGGAIVGAALESSSFRYGQFNDICTSITLLTAANKEITCSPTQNSDLYNAIAGSYGTLGRVISAEIECVPAADNVLVTAHVFANIPSAQAFMNKTMSNSGVDFVDGLIYSDRSAASLYVIVTASMQQAISNDIPHFHVEKHHSGFYYEHISNQAQRVLRNEQQTSSFQFQMSLTGFLFRYDRGAFWMAKPISFSLSLIIRSPMLIPLFVITHNNPLCRFLFRRLFTTSILYRLLNKAHPDVIARKMVIMDVYVPLSKLELFLQFIKDHIPITTPLWICPVKCPPKSQRKQWFSPHGVCPEEMMVDVGIYGRVADGQGKHYTRLLDQWCMEYGARKMLYSQHSYTKEEFWKSKTNPNGIFDNETYQALRKKHEAEKLPELFDKVIGGSTEQKSRRWSLKERLHWFMSWLLL